MDHAPAKLSLQAFLEWENEQPERHEYHCGDVLSMGDSRRVEGLVLVNLALALGNFLHRSPCHCFATSMQVQIGTDTLLYPDLFVTCDAADLRTEMIFTAPTVVVEIISPTSQAYDRGAKFALYRRIPSLREYLLVDPDTREVELFRRSAVDGLFTLHDMTGRLTVTLESLGCELLTAEIFDGVEPGDAEPPA